VLSGKLPLFPRIFALRLSPEQKLAQDVVDHLRNYHSLLKVSRQFDTVMARIRGVEADVERNLSELEALCSSEDPELASFRPLLLARMQRIEDEARNQIHETVQPSAEFISKKRRLRSVDDFLDAFLEFLEAQPEKCP
jgi:hypothetical protein